MKNKNSKKPLFATQLTAILAFASLSLALFMALFFINIHSDKKIPLLGKEQGAKIAQTTKAKPVSYKTLPLLTEVKPKELLQAAKKREEVLKEEIKTDPKSFLEHATLADTRDEFPKDVQEHVEQKIEAQGTLTVIHKDNPEKKESSFAYRLQVAGAKEPYNLYFVKNPPQLLTGSTVKIKGIGIDNVVAMESGDDSGATYKLHTVSAAKTYAIGEQKTAVILINFQNNTSQPISKQELEKLFFSKTDRSVSKYYMENSFGKTYFTGQVFDWITVPYTNTVCNEYGWTSSAEDTLKNQGVDLTNYQRIVYIFADTYSCGGGGFGTIGGHPSRSWIYSAQDDIRIHNHELGHNIGLHHSNQMICEDGTVINTADKCKSWEYDDIYDVMGNFWYVGNSTHYFNVPHRIGLGWIDQEKVRPVMHSGTYNVYASELPSAAVKALKIPREKTNDFFYLSYRQPVGFDANLPKEMTSGASIHIWNDINSVQTKALDIDKSDRWNTQKALADNQTFYDPINNITIKQLSHDRNGVKLQITIGTPIAQPLSFIKPWYDTSELASAVTYGHSVVAGNHIVTIGGYEDGKTYFDDMELTRKVQTAKILGNGPVATGKLTTPLPEAVTDPAVAASGDYVYVVGGTIIERNTTNNFIQGGGGGGDIIYDIATVYVGKVLTDGTITSWNTTTNVPVTLNGHTVVAANNYLYVVGGFQNGSSTAKSVYYAPIHTDGTLGNWQETTNFPYELFYGTTITANGYMYAAGGWSYNANYQYKLFYVAKIQADGTLGTWRKLEKSESKTQSGTLIGFEKYILSLGGYDQEGPRKDIHYAVVSDDGTLSDWTQDTSLPELMYSFSAVIKDSYLYILGGYIDSTGIQTNILSAKFSPTIEINVPPVGAFESITDAGYITGWAADPNTPDDEVAIHVYVDQPSISSFPAKTSVVSQEARSAGFTTGNHGFSIRIPDKYRDGKEHTYTVYAINTQKGKNPMLAGSSKTFTLNGNFMPTGDIGALTSDDYLMGWAFDPNNATASATVLFYVDNSQEPSFSVVTDMTNTAVNERFKTTGKHGFKVKLPSQYKDDKPHTVNAYIVSMYGEKKELSNSPRSTFTPQSKTPIGKLEAITTDGFVKGWAFDPDKKDGPIKIWVIIDSTYMYYADAKGETDVLREDVNKAKNLTGTHGFSIPVPVHFYNSSVHTFHVYALDDVTETLYPLTDSGMTFSFPAGATSGTPASPIQ